MEQFDFELLKIVKEKSPMGSGLDIHDALEEKVGKGVSFLHMYDTLSILERAGFITAEWVESGPEHGGLKRCLYTIEAPGIEAIKHQRG